ncbi:uncharacterized protein LOC120980917 [Bufo bufo]|uniref:uncharacterized protein LOC120980917 n=1 Tax=Bufo bufo TaxID=8384 RepID=UPI001ABE64C7|nr:uncharacterized protein LOC120980917 [Bufo bufo]
MDSPTTAADRGSPGSTNVLCAFLCTVPPAPGQTLSAPFCARCLQHPVRLSLRLSVHGASSTRPDSLCAFLCTCLQHPVRLSVHGASSTRSDSLCAFLCTVPPAPGQTFCARCLQHPVRLSVRLSVHGASSTRSDSVRLSVHGASSTRSDSVRLSVHGASSTRSDSFCARCLQHPVRLSLRLSVHGASSTRSDSLCASSAQAAAFPPDTSSYLRPCCGISQVHSTDSESCLPLSTGEVSESRSPRGP